MAVEYSWLYDKKIKTYKMWQIMYNSMLNNHKTI